MPKVGTALSLPKIGLKRGRSLRDVEKSDTKVKSPTKFLKLKVNASKDCTTTPAKSSVYLRKRVARLMNESSDINVYLMYPELNCVNLQEQNLMNQASTPPMTRSRLQWLLGKTQNNVEMPTCSLSPTSSNTSVQSKPPRKSAFVPQYESSNLMSENLINQASTPRMTRSGQWLHGKTLNNVEVPTYSLSPTSSNTSVQSKPPRKSAFVPQYERSNLMSDNLINQASTPRMTRSRLQWLHGKTLNNVEMPTYSLSPTSSNTSVQSKPPRKSAFVPRYERSNLMSENVGCDLCKKYPKLNFYKVDSFDMEQ